MSVSPVDDPRKSLSYDTDSWRKVFGDVRFRFGSPTIGHLTPHLYGICDGLSPFVPFVMSYVRFVFRSR